MTCIAGCSLLAMHVLFCRVLWLVLGTLITQTMPKVLEYFGMIFYFYSNEHLPIHIHVSYNECESVFEIFFENGALREVLLRKSKGQEPLPAAQLKEAQKVVEHYAQDIVNKWTDFFVLKKKVKSLKITRRL